MATDDVEDALAVARRLRRSGLDRASYTFTIEDKEVTVDVYIGDAGLEPYVTEPDYHKAWHADAS